MQWIRIRYRSKKYLMVSREVASSLPNPATCSRAEIRKQVVSAYTCGDVRWRSWESKRQRQAVMESLLLCHEHKLSEKMSLRPRRMAPRWIHMSKYLSNTARQRPDEAESLGVRR